MLRPGNLGSLDDFWFGDTTRIQRKARAVSRSNFNTLAMQTPNINQATTLRLFHPSTKETPGSVSVLVVPD